MSGTGVKPSPSATDPDILSPGLNGNGVSEPQEFPGGAERQAQILRLLWSRRPLLVRTSAIALLTSTLVAFLIPRSYTSTAQLMPPDTQSASGMAMMAAMAAKGSSGLAGIAGDLLGLKSSGALFIGVLRSQTAQDRLIQQFDLQRVYALYGKKLLVDARARLDENTAISEDRKSGIISISVTDHDPQRAAALANAYVDGLNSLVAQLSTSAAHRERVFLEERLKVAKLDLDDAANQLALFSSKNNTLDIQTEGKAMLDAAGTLAGQLIAAQSELEGLRQIYTDNNSRVRALSARVGELRKQLEKLGGSQEAGTAGRPANGAVSAGADPPTAPQAPDVTASGRIGNMPFPTIRNLPLLGAKYGDYYRRAKIQETVFELLTEQYELAKVEEAKETPSVKVLDPGRVPERKSFPPRLLIIFLGTGLACACSVVWVLAVKSWEQADPNDPRKILAREVTATLKAHAPWTSQNGNAPGTFTQKIWGRVSRRPPTDDSTDR
ncbi:MAG TPA: Wzz/FepE/Etk N-terminal domain-containing protein [Candidatus Bathyarchaeia archaeon]|nr:Wzz/FepE/Etk N-terminal domain-containing protein [Candidatus Bathyarchaeia archaeon]